MASPRPVTYLVVALAVVGCGQSQPVLPLMEVQNSGDVKSMDTSTHVEEDPASPGREAAETTIDAVNLDLAGCTTDEQIEAVITRIPKGGWHLGRAATLKKLGFDETRFQDEPRRHGSSITNMCMTEYWLVSPSYCMSFHRFAQQDDVVIVEFRKSMPRKQDAPGE